MRRKKELSQFFRQTATKIRIHTAIATINDPYERDESLSYLPCKVVRAIVSDLTSTQLQYKSAGIITTSGKEIIIEKKYENLLKLSNKITIDNEDFYGWRKNGRMEYRKEGDFVRAYIYRKEETNA